MRPAVPFWLTAEFCGRALGLGRNGLAFLLRHDCTYEKSRSLCKDPGSCIREAVHGGNTT